MGELVRRLLRLGLRLFVLPGCAVYQNPPSRQVTIHQPPQTVHHRVSWR